MLCYLLSWLHQVRAWNLVGPSAFTTQQAASCPSSSVNSALQQWLVTASLSLIVAFAVRFVLKLTSSVKAPASPVGSPRSRPRKVAVPVPVAVPVTVAVPVAVAVPVPVPAPVFLLPRCTSIWTVHGNL